MIIKNVFKEFRLQFFHWFLNLIFVVFSQKIDIIDSTVVEKHHFLSVKNEKIKNFS